MSEGAPPSLYDVSASADGDGDHSGGGDGTNGAHVSRLRRSRTISDRLFNLVDRENAGKVTFEEFVQHGRHSSVFNLAMSLLGKSAGTSAHRHRPLRVLPVRLKPHDQWLDVQEL